VALALAGVSATFSIDGLTAIFAGAFWPVVIMGAVLEAGKLVAAAWLTEHWNSAPSLLRLVLVAMIGVLMGLNAIGVFGFLTRANLDHMASMILPSRTGPPISRLALRSRDGRSPTLIAASPRSTRPLRNRRGSAVPRGDDDR
jgi:hypothetical protein